MSAPTQNRQPAGTPIGGQFAETRRQEADTTLTTDDPWALALSSGPYYVETSSAEVLWDDGIKQLLLSHQDDGLEVEVRYDVWAADLITENADLETLNGKYELVNQFFYEEYGGSFGNEQDDEAISLYSAPLGHDPLTTQQINDAINNEHFHRLERELTDADEPHQTTAGRKLRDFLARKLNPDTPPQPVQSPAHLYDLVHRTLEESPHHDAYFTERITPHLRGMNAADYENDFFHPIARAIWRGDRDRALELAVKAFSHDEREARWKNDPDFTPPSIDIVDRDDMYGAKHIGSKYQPGRPLREVAKDVRADIKKAVSAGYLPDLDYRVRIDTKGTSAIRVVASGMPDEDCYNAEVTHYSNGQYDLVQSDRANIAERRIRGIVGAYAHQQSNSQVDYFNNSFWIDTKIQSATETAAVKAAEEEWALQSQVRRATDPAEKNRLAAQRLAARARRDQAEQDRQQARARIIGQAQ